MRLQRRREEEGKNQSTHRDRKKESTQKKEGKPGKPRVTLDRESRERDREGLP